MARRVLPLFLLFALAGCGDEVSSSVELPANTARRTTDGALARRNLEASIAALEARLTARPDDVGAATALLDRLAMRAHFFGAAGDLDRMLAVTERLVSQRPNDANALLLRAQARASVHRFTDAAADVDRAELAGADAERVRARRLGLFIARGVDLEPAVAERRAAAVDSPSFDTLTALATAEIELEEHLRAEAAFVDAANAYRDVSPFPVAWIDFQRGVMWAERANDRDAGERLYASALARLPDYVVARVHTAEIRLARGDADAAVRLLEPIASSVLDPEPAAVLGAALRARGDSAAAEPFEGLAESHYTTLLERHPLAYADHAARFYLARDPVRALRWAETNLVERHGLRAFALAIEAAHAAGRPERACELVTTARALHGADAFAGECAVTP